VIGSARAGNAYPSDSYFERRSQLSPKLNGRGHRSAFNKPSNAHQESRDGSKPSESTPPKGKEFEINVAEQRQGVLAAVRDGKGHASRCQARGVDEVTGQARSSETPTRNRLIG